MRRVLFPAGLMAVGLCLVMVERGCVDQNRVLAIAPLSMLALLTVMEFVAGRWKPAAKRLPRDLGFFVLGGLLDAGGRVLVGALALSLGSTGFGPALLLPSLIGVPLGLVVADLGAWLVHRAFHAHPRLWRMHARHHSPTELYALMSSVNSPVMILIIRAVPPLLLVLTGFQPFVLFAWTLLDAWIGMSSHTGIDTHNPWLSEVFVTPEVHRLHHSADPEHAGNHGLAITLWDRLFGTWRAPARYPGVPTPGLPPSPGGRGSKTTQVRAFVLLILLCATSAAAQQDPDPWFAPDKALHFSLSAGLAGLGYGGAALFTEDRGIRLAVGAGVALTAGIAKELLDLTGFGHPSWKDLAWDVAGTAVGLVISWLVDHFVITPLAQPRPALHRPALTQGVGEFEHASMVAGSSSGGGGVFVVGLVALAR